MRTPSSFPLATVAIAALALSACSKETQKNASDTATSASNDISGMAADASEGIDSLGASASKGAEDAKTFGEKVGAAADKMGDGIAEGARGAKDEMKDKPSPTPSGN
jgi:hypothetical protein